jgi:uncharacterized protein
MRVIDSDTHVDETEATWEHIPDEAAAMRPVAGTYDDPTAPRHYWAIDGYQVHRAKRVDANTKTTRAQRELLDVDARLRHMDELGVEVQVIYPTIFNRNPAVRPEIERRLTQSYNRWMAERTAIARGRLRWVCVLPWRSLDAAADELRFAKDHGACGVLKKGDREADRLVWEEYFWPVYAEAEQLDLPICFHQGTGRVVYADPSGATPETDFLDQKAPAINGIASLLARDVPRRFPRLRFGCVEVGASWVALVDHMYRRRLANTAARENRQPPIVERIFETNRVWTTCEVDEDLSTVLRYISEDHLLVGSDYGHNDPSQEHGFVAKLRQLAASGVISPDAPEKIMWDNPRRFYGL